MNISTIDLIVFIAYCLLILLVGLFVSRRGQKGETQDASNYFLAGRGLAWWANRGFYYCIQYLGRTVCRHVGLRLCRSGWPWRRMNGLRHWGC